VGGVCERVESPLSRDEVRVLAEEQSALRRVATLVARGVPPEQLFAAVTEEVGQLLPVEFALMGRYEADDTVMSIATWGSPVARFPIGRRWSLGGKNLATIVRETGRPGRIDHADGSSGSIGAVGRESGFRSTVGAPIIVEGRVWGAMTVGSMRAEPPLPVGIEGRLAEFTDLLATAIANAESRAGLAKLAEEQAALRRVATLVAGGMPQEEVFAAVIAEVVRLLPVDFARMGRYEPDGTLAVLAASGRTDDHFPVGRRLAPGWKNLGRIVAQTGRSARLDGVADSPGPGGVSVREMGVRSAVATPVIVEGRPWGVIAAGSTFEQPLPADTEARLASFTELVATAISNVNARERMQALADEQAGLRRVATLVARGEGPKDVFRAVNEEVARLIPVTSAAMGRYAPGGTCTTVAAWSVDGGHVFPVGDRWDCRGNHVTGIVLRTGRPARLDDFSRASGPIGVHARNSGYRSAVGCPITVEGRLWGLISAASTAMDPLPADTEGRLASFTELVAMAIANAESRAALADSRARVVAAADESRRRIERDLHDGAQQRLVHAVIVLKLALRALSNGDTNATELVAEGLRHAEQANFELRELAHGILPAALTRGGLGAGLEALVSRVPLPVDTSVSTGRLPASVEATAYFVVSEALTNVVKHARADRATVTAQVDHELLRLEIRDDGVGGANPGEGSGLVGLSDRVEALGGTLKLVSPTSEGTTMMVEIPVQVHSSGSSPES
jgi:signal transduction histidine kinase